MINDKEMNTDLDGVLADFESHASAIIGAPMHSVSKSKVWKAIYAYDTDVQPFFGSLPMMEDALVLWDFLTENFSDNKILTATGYTPKDAAQQKTGWVRNHIDSDVVVRTVTKSSEKAMYANPNAVLIDDRDKSIDPWVAAGGIGILHTSAADTIAQLKAMFNI